MKGRGKQGRGGRGPTTRVTRSVARARAAAAAAVAAGTPPATNTTEEVEAPTGASSLFTSFAMADLPTQLQLLATTGLGSPTSENSSSSSENKGGPVIDDGYGDIHRLVLQGVIAAGFLDAKGVKKLFTEACSLLKCRVPVDEHTAPPFIQRIVREINEKIKVFDMLIRSSTCEISGEKYYMFLVTIEKQVMKFQTYFRRGELELFQKLLQAISRTNDNYAMPLCDCVNLAHGLHTRGFSVANAEEFIERMVRLQYLAHVPNPETDENEITLGFRTIREFEPAFRDQFADCFINCGLCKMIMLNGLQCPKCLVVVHRACFSKYIKCCTLCIECKCKWRRSAMRVRSRKTSASLASVSTERMREETSQSPPPGTSQNSSSSSSRASPTEPSMIDELYPPRRRSQRRNSDGRRQDSDECTLKRQPFQAADNRLPIGQPSIVIPLDRPSHPRNLPEQSATLNQNEAISEQPNEYADMPRLEPMVPLTTAQVTEMRRRSKKSKASLRRATRSTPDLNLPAPQQRSSPRPGTSTQEDVKRKTNSNLTTHGGTEKPLRSATATTTTPGSSSQLESQSYSAADVQPGPSSRLRLPQGSPNSIGRKPASDVGSTSNSDSNESVSISDAKSNLAYESDPQYETDTDAESDPDAEISQIPSSDLQVGTRIKSQRKAQPSSESGGDDNELALVRGTEVALKFRPKRQIASDPDAVDSNNESEDTSNSESEQRSQYDDENVDRQQGTQKGLEEPSSDDSSSEEEVESEEDDLPDVGDEYIEETGHDAQSPRRSRFTLIRHALTDSGTRLVRGSMDAAYVMTPRPITPDSVGKVSSSDEADAELGPRSSSQYEIEFENDIPPTPGAGLFLQKGDNSDSDESRSVDGQKQSDGQKSKYGQDDEHEPDREESDITGESEEASETGSNTLFVAVGEGEPDTEYITDEAMSEGGNQSSERSETESDELNAPRGRPNPDSELESDISV